MSRLESMTETFGTASPIRDFLRDLGQVLEEHPVHMFSSIIKTEYELRRLAQQKAQYRNFLAEKKYTSAEERHTYQKSLRKVEEGYLFLCQTWIHQKDALPDGPLTWGFEFCRAHPTWYMNPALVKYCADKGGCCARGCECCVKRGSSSLGAGHCTPDCTCCMEARGLKLNGAVGQSREFAQHASEYRLEELSMEMKRAILLG